MLLPSNSILCGRKSSQDYSSIDNQAFHNSNNRDFGTSNCFERSKEKGGGVDEPGEDPETDEADDHQHDDLAKQGDDVGHISQTTDMSHSIPSYRVTIKDMIENTKCGIQSKSYVLNQTLKKTGTVNDCLNNESDVIMTNDNKSNSNGEEVETSQDKNQTQVDVAVYKRIIIVDGKPKIDQSSLLIEQSQIRKEDNLNNYKVINESGDSKSSSLIYPKKSISKKWTYEETEFFYQCLAEFGTDFSMIESKFNGNRNRSQIKNKFRKEEKENLDRIDQAIIYRKVLPTRKRDSKNNSKASSEIESNSE